MYIHIIFSAFKLSLRYCNNKVMIGSNEYVKKWSAIEHEHVPSITEQSCGVNYSH